jgi:hypothetical protein
VSITNVGDALSNPLRRILNAVPNPVGKLANRDAVDLASTAAKNRMKLVVLQQALCSDYNVPACFSTAWGLCYRCIDCKMSFTNIAYVFSKLATWFFGFHLRLPA